jgi:hypothetical protein
MLMGWSKLITCDESLRYSLNPRETEITPFKKVIRNTVTLNGHSSWYCLVIQQTNFQGLYNSFKLMTTLSPNDIITQGAAMGFYPDDALSVVFSAADSVNGKGTCFTQNQVPTVPVTGTFNSYTTGNIGMIKRQQYINYDPAGVAALTSPDAGAATWASLFTANSAQLAYKSHIFNKVDGGAATRGCCQWAINGIVKLRHICDMMASMPLLKGTFLKITLQLNNSVVKFSSAAAGAAFTGVSVQVGSGGISPLQIASSAAGNGSAAPFIAGDYTLSLAVGATVLSAGQTAASQASPMGRNVTLNVPSYVFDPEYEAAYAASPMKTIVYEDLYQYTVLNVAAGGIFNNLITNGLANITKVLVLPYFTATSNGGLSPLVSPFDAAGTGVTSPLCLLQNFQILMSGANLLYNSQKYSYQEFVEQLSGCNSINGDLTDGLTSGLVGLLDFETAYNYYFVNASRYPAMEKRVPKSISIQGTNLSAKAIDLFVFLVYEQTISVDIRNGARV